LTSNEHTRTIEIEAKTIGLCISGGGFRASFYALGALRYLAEAGLLRRVEAISSVSGGAIAAAMVVDRWADFIAAGGGEQAFLAHIDKPFRDRITNRNLRNRWLGRALIRDLWPNSPGRGIALGRTLAKNLYNHDRVADLPTRPQVIFTSTDLTSGRAFRIAHDFVGNYDYGYAEPTPNSIELGTAVAASAAFPMALSVIWLPTPSLPNEGTPETLSLHDGGVYDNLGLEWFQGWDPRHRPKSALQPDFLIVVNASGPHMRTNQFYGALRALRRDMAIQYQQTLALRVRWLIGEWLAKPGRGVYIGINRDPRKYTYEQKPNQRKGDPIDPTLYEGALPLGFSEPLSRLRTDLDRFSPLEAALLSYHAYWSLHARLGMFFPNLTVTTPAWRLPGYDANMRDAQKTRLLALLARGAKTRPWRRADDQPGLAGSRNAESSSRDA
jgi:NTE family protein